MGDKDLNARTFARAWFERGKMGSDLNAQLRGRHKIYATVEYSAFAHF